MYFPSSRGCLIALLMALPLSTSVSVITSLFQILITTLLLPSEKDPYVYTGSIWIIQDNLLISMSFLNFITPAHPIYKVTTYPQVLVNRMWIYLGAIILPISV